MPFINTERYAVEAGDTLYAISRKTGWSVRSLIFFNPQIMSNPNLLFIGQVLRVPVQSMILSYSVKPGDTLYSILRRHNQEAIREGVDPISFYDLLGYNPNITDPNMIYPGMKIALPEYG